MSVLSVYMSAVQRFKYHPFCDAFFTCFGCNFSDGIFLPDIVKYARLCRKAKEREYRYQQKLYYGRLLRELLVNRQVSGVEAAIVLYVHMGVRDFIKKLIKILVAVISN